MKRSKELKKIAKQIAALEYKLQSTESKEEESQLQNAIIKLSNQVEDLEEVYILDNLIQECLSILNK